MKSSYCSLMPETIRMASSLGGSTETTQSGPRALRPFPLSSEDRRECPWQCTAVRRAQAAVENMDRLEEVPGLRLFRPNRIVPQCREWHLSGWRPRRDRPSRRGLRLRRKDALGQPGSRRGEGAASSRTRMRRSERAAGTVPSASRCAKPCSDRVFPTPGSPIRTGLFLVRRDRIWMVVQFALASNQWTGGARLPPRSGRESLP